METRVSIREAYLGDFKVINSNSGLQIRVRTGYLFSLFLVQNICCGYLKEPSL